MEEALGLDVDLVGVVRTLVKMRPDWDLTEACAKDQRFFTRLCTNGTLRLLNSLLETLPMMHDLDDPKWMTRYQSLLNETAAARKHESGCLDGSPSRARSRDQAAHFPATTGRRTLKLCRDLARY